MIPGNWFHNHTIQGSGIAEMDQHVLEGIFPTWFLLCLTILISLTKIKYVHKHRWVRLLTFLLFTSCSSIPLNFHLLYFQIDYENVGHIKKPHRRAQKYEKMKNRKQLRDWQSSQKTLSLLHNFDLNYYQLRTLSQCQNTKFGLWLIKKPASRKQFSICFFEFCAQQIYKRDVQK